MRSSSRNRGCYRSSRLALARIGQHLDLLRNFRCDLGLDLDLDIEGVTDRFLLDAIHHGGEEVESFALIFHQGIALRHGPEADAIAQVIHLIQVLAPFAIEHGQDDLALQFPGDVFPEFCFPSTVGRLSVIDKNLRKEVRTDSGAAATRILFYLLNGHRHRIQLLESRPQLLKIPIFGVALGRGLRYVAVDRVVDEGANLVFDVFAVEHSLALPVDDQALAVEDVVVLENVLANFEVLRFDLRLRGSDRVRHHLGFDRYVIRDVEATQEGIDHVGLEQAHQIVFQRKVELRLARVALSTRAATQLVVDTSRFMALGG